VEFEPVVPFERCFDAQYGLEVVAEDIEAGTVTARVAVRDVLLNHLGVLHGGVFAAAAESIASYGTAFAVMPHGRWAMGLSNDTSVVHSPREGVVEFDARAHARAGDAWLWTVDARDDSGRLCALSRVTVAVR
jgi:uncharacterized protein (TIGR00369 family)